MWYKKFITGFILLKLKPENLIPSIPCCTNILKQFISILFVKLINKNICLLIEIK